LLPSSASRQLDPVPQLPQHIADFLTFLALNLDHPILHRAATAAGLFDGLAKGGHVRFGEYEPLQERHTLATAPLGLSVQGHSLQVGRQRDCLSHGFVFFIAQVALLGAPDGAGIIRRHIDSVDENGGDVNLFSQVSCIIKDHPLIPKIGHDVFANLREFLKYWREFAEKNIT